MRKHVAVISAGAVTILCGNAFAENIKDIKNMDAGSNVTISATVESVQNEREFTIRDQTGTMKVDIESQKSVVLKPGDNVTVTGSLDNGIINKNIDATDVTVNKNVAQAVGDAIEMSTGVSLEGATTYNINSLPNTGLVKVSGTVVDVDSEKEFTVKDATGSVDIDVQSAETVALTTGAEVTVIGYVDKGIFGKDIRAHKVLIVADATPMAKTQ